MRILIRHEIVQNFSPPAKSLVQILRLSPRDCESQLIAAWNHDFDIDCRMRSAEDTFGNLVHTLHADGGISHFSIVAYGEVETFDTAGVVRGAPDRFALDLFLRDTDQTMHSPEIRAFALEAVKDARSALDKPHHLMRAVHARVRYSPDARMAANATEALARGAGPDQDGAHVFIAAARILGIPARCVSGYLIHDELEQDGGQPLIRGLHVWAEAHVPGLGWIGFDPAICLCMHEGHVRCATGLDYLGATALRAAHFVSDKAIVHVNVSRAAGAHNANQHIMQQRQS